MIIAETNRLILSKITVEDASFLLELMNTPGWLKYNGDRNVKNLEQAITHVKNNQLKCYENHGFGYYKIQLKDEDLKTIGTSGLLKRDNLEHVDIGFSLLPEYHSKGYGFETATEIMNLAKNTFNLKTISAITLPINQPSINLLEKLGLSYQKTIKPFEDNKELLLFAKDL
ncbi:GNAT family N-acetyltransferase [Psychroserpens ponticola]|uniref:GNAT family N-acetyltransferase n=1 Tax=Psychroserpens ponticola TaxID=2932268 RepID=A0ABY7RXQ2_9FLAO|nr:GNAT family N-acetyltransferase [Psychroserpens ponticola]WCO01916.1 GNAT family N-acetyltransferase [Psychroserpens ponticola]